MDTDNLIRMANRIGDFFDAYPDKDEACRGIADHLRRFWEPRMRRDLFERIDQDGAPELHPIVLQAVRQNRSQLQPAPGAA